MQQEVDAKWIEYFKSNGFPFASAIGVGMEGSVYSLRQGELVAKVWHQKNELHLRILQEFYDALKVIDGRILTPDIRDIRVIDGTLVSFERFLPGMLLQHKLTEDALHADQAAVQAIVRVLTFLRSVSPQAAMRNLPVLDETVPPWRKATCWSEAALEILSRRIQRFGPLLAQAVPRLDDVIAAVTAFLPTRDNVEMGLLHGDLCGANVMVDEAWCPVAVFDFGFLSTKGDPAFDASISSAIFNMYGPKARSIDDEVIEIFARELGYPRKVLLAYRALYGLLTSNAYSAEGADGHFRWSVSMLNRNDVRAAIEL